MAFPLGERFAGLLSRGLKEELTGRLTDGFLEALLQAMAVFFALSRSYRRQIEGFSATYLFATADGKVAASAVFQEGRMKVIRQMLPQGEVLVTFKDSRSLCAFLLAENQDILASLLSGEVEVDGNLNYLYKFGFMVRDLVWRLKVKR